MKQHVADQHYGGLVSHERFVLLLEAMARKDDREADRLEQTCPMLSYRGEDQGFRDRMRRAYMIASRVALDLQGGLAQLRLVHAFCQHGSQLAWPVVGLAQAAFLYGREYAKWEAGVIDSIGLPDRQAIALETAENPELDRQLDELNTLGQQSVTGIVERLSEMICRAHAVEMLSRWEGFGRFCKKTPGMEAEVLMRAFELGCQDVAAEVRAACPDAKLDEAMVGEWAARWTACWKRRFA